MANLLMRGCLAAQLLAQPLAGSLAQETRVAVEIIELAQLIEQSDRMARRVRTAAFLMNQQLAERAGEQMIGRHSRPLN